ADDQVVAEQFVKTRKQPLHQGKLFAFDAVAATPDIESRMEDIGIFLIKIEDNRLHLRLAPNMRADQISMEGAPMHHRAERRKEKQQNVKCVFPQKRQNVGEWHGHFHGANISMSYLAATLPN